LVVGFVIWQPLANPVTIAKLSDHRCDINILFADHLLFQDRLGLVCQKRSGFERWDNCFFDGRITKYRCYPLSEFIDIFNVGRICCRFIQHLVLEILSIVAIAGKDTMKFLIIFLFLSPALVLEILFELCEVAILAAILIVTFQVLLQIGETLILLIKF